MASNQNRQASGKHENTEKGKHTRTPGLIAAAIIAFDATCVILISFLLSTPAPKSISPQGSNGKEDGAEVAENPLLFGPQQAGLEEEKPESQGPPLTLPTRLFVGDPPAKKEDPFADMPGLTPLLRWQLSGRRGQPSAAVVCEYLQREGVQIEELASCNRPSKTLSYDDRDIQSLAFSPEGDKVAASFRGRPNKLIVWGLAQEKRLLTMEGKVGEHFFHTEFSSDGKFLAAYKPLLDGSTLTEEGFTDWTPIIGVWDVETWKTVHQFKGFGHLFAFSPDGNSLVTPERKSNFKLAFIDMPSGIRGASLKGDDEGIYALGFAPNGRMLAFGCHDATIKLIDVPSGKVKGVIQGYFKSNYRLCLSFSPDGKLLAFSADDLEAGRRGRGVVLYDVAAGKIVDLLPTWFAPRCCRFSPDGKTLAASAFGGIYLYDVAMRKPRMLLQGHDNKAGFLCFSADGKKLASAGGGKICIWDVSR